MPKLIRFLQIILKIKDLNEYFNNFVHNKYSNKLFKMKMRCGLKVWLISNPDSRSAFNEVFLSEEYQYFKMFNQKCNEIWDIGGFMGFTSMYFSRLSGKKIHIYEPILENQNIIELNLKENHLSE